MEKNYYLLSPTGITGVLVPSAFHSGEGATGIRKLYLENMRMHCCYSFENTKKIFDIHSSQKFAVVVASKDSITSDFECGFYLHDDEWLFDGHRANALIYSMDFIKAMDDKYLAFPELKDKQGMLICSKAYSGTLLFKEYMDRAGINLAVELNMSKDSKRFVPSDNNNGLDIRTPNVHASLLDKGNLLLIEGKHIWQFDDCYGPSPRYIVPLTHLSDKKHFLQLPSLQICFQDVSGATNERTVVFSLEPPGVVFGDTVKAPERSPFNRPNYKALVVVSMMNSYPIDFLGRLKGTSHVSLFMVEGLPVPKLPESFLAHNCLRLTANHSGYAPLWKEQIGDARREKTPSNSWPVIQGEEERWSVKAMIDAVVANGYGFSREAYSHILSTFSHKSYPDAPACCLYYFNEIQKIGIEEFIKKNDPYWDIPLNKDLPKPVLSLGVSESGDIPSLFSKRSMSLKPKHSYGRKTKPRKK